jgi:NAD(P)-dependent dehydrogenase (short-subunit alcohol dehydrogenase family)
MKRRDVDGRVVVITGGGGGIGAALAERFVATGARVALLDRDGEALATVAARLPAAALSTHALDVCDADACGATMAEVVERWGGIDVLLNNAGISHRSLFRDTELDVLRSVMEVNFFGAVHCTEAALPALIERRGLIGVTSSVAGFAPLLGRTGYCASKHALHGFFDTLRVELAPQGVDVMMICPSYVATGIGGRALSGRGNALGNGKRAVAGREMSADELAEKVVRASARRQRLLAPSALSRASWWLSRVAPRAYERLMLRSQQSEFSPPAGR